MSATSSRPSQSRSATAGVKSEKPGPLGEARNGLAGAAIPGVQRRGVRRQDHVRDAVAGDVGQRRRADEGEPWIGCESYLPERAKASTSKVAGLNLSRP